MPNLNGDTDLVSLADAAESILNADLLLFRATGIVSRAIRVVSRSRYSHAAKATWHRGTLMAAEVRELKGGRLVTLRSQVMKYPGAIDVYRANAENRWIEYDRDAADDAMIALAGCRYGYRSLLKASLFHLPIVRWMMTPPTNDEVRSANAPYCSAACAMADDLGGGVDVVPNLANWAVAPGDLARSLFYRYLFTLVP